MIVFICDINIGGFKMTGENERLFSEGNIAKVLIKFSIPAVLSFLVTELYNMVDTVFVGRAVGGNAIGALVVVFPIQRIVAALSMMFAIGTSTSVSRRNGERNREGIIKTIQNSLSITILTLTSFMFLTFFFRTNLLKFLGASENILPYAEEYLSIIIWGSIFICLTTVMNYIMMSLGNRKITMVSTSIGAIMNTIVDAVLVIGLGMGVKGAAIATLLSQIVACMISFYQFRKDVISKYNLKLKFQLDKLFIMGIVTVGFSAFIVEAEDGILLAFLNNLMLNNVGDEGVIILGIITKISMFMFITMLGMGSAMQPIAAYNLGAKNYDRLKDVVRDTVIFALITSIGLWLLTFIFAPQIVSIFVKDPDIIEKSVKAFRVMVSVFPIVSIYYVSIYYYQSIGKARSSFILSILRQIIIMLPVSIFMVKVLNLGAYGIWLSYPIADMISGVVAIVLIIKSIKEIDRYIELNEDDGKNLRMKMNLEKN